MERGHYFQTRRRTAIRCKGYSAPPFEGNYLGTVDPGVYLGPVETWLDTDRYTTVLIHGWWINIWERKQGEFGTDFAEKVDRMSVHYWHTTGWRDIY